LTLLRSNDLSPQRFSFSLSLYTAKKTGFRPSPLLVG
jgi:hypothetical protein